MASTEKMSSGNADKAFVRNCDLDSDFMPRIQSIGVVFQYINVLHNNYYGNNAAIDIKIIKRLLKDEIIATICSYKLFINCNLVIFLCIF